MTDDEVAARVAAEIAAHDAPVAGRTGAMRWTPQRLRAEFAALARALVPPEQAAFVLRDEAILISSGEPEVREYWVVAFEVSIVSINVPSQRTWIEPAPDDFR